MYCMPRRCRISSENIAEPSGAPNSTVNAAAIPAIVTQRASCDRKVAPAREPTRERAARRDERRLRARPRRRPRSSGATSGSATAACARRARCPRRGCCRRAARRRPGCRAAARSRRPPTPVAPSTANSCRRCSSDRARARAAADGTRGGRRRRRRRWRDRRARSHAEQRGRHAHDAVIEESRAGTTSRTYRSTISSCVIDREPASRTTATTGGCSSSEPGCASSSIGANSKRPPSASRPRSTSSCSRSAGTHADDAPTIGDVADALLLRHHSAVGLVDRAVECRASSTGTPTPSTIGSSDCDSPPSERDASASSAAHTSRSCDASRPVCGPYGRTSNQSTTRSREHAAVYTTV